MDLSNPNTAEIVQYVDPDMIKNMPDGIGFGRNLLKEMRDEKSMEMGWRTSTRI